VEDITQYARLDVTHRGVESGTAWATLIARLLLGLPTMAAGLWKLFHIGPFVQTRMFFVAPLSGTAVPVWLRWLIGYPLPYVEMIAGGMLLLGTQTRGAVLAVAATLILTTLGTLVHEPLHDIPMQLLPRIGLVLYLLAMPESGDRWSLDRWLERRGMVSG